LSAMKVVAIVGKRKTGKTSLIEQLIAALKEHGKVGCIKHAHELELSSPVARDTDRFFIAGAAMVVGASPNRTITLTGERSLTDLIEEMASAGVDFLLVEGFKNSDLPKLSLSDFPPQEVQNILARVELSGNPETQAAVVRDVVQRIRSLNEY
jgi:molybdopterin-guanine dinucleotide biosynthesis protein MobB